ncbi:unnamed protein product [Blepharisma stoltei]|uniref:FYVE-type domain-containing protein n=1 Tax=Blepharisma stoltei TaxID=1481888 RepID=A0AAU9IHP1_9CILI|nr:unnamed protein product [Blepharisma stoltei]
MISKSSFNGVIVRSTFTITEEDPKISESKAPASELSPGVDSIKLTIKESSKSERRNLMRGTFAGSASPKVNQSKNCHICGKKFKLGLKYTCKICLQAVCGEDSQKKPFGDNPKKRRICNQCDEAETRQIVREELKENLERVHEELRSAKGCYDRLNRERFDKTAKINEFEFIKKSMKAQHEQKMQKLQNQLDEEKQRSSDQRISIENLEKTISNLNLSKREWSEKCEAKKNETEEWSKRLDLLLERRNLLANQAEHLEHIMDGKVAIEELEKRLCSKCKKKVFHNNQECRSDLSMVHYQSSDTQKIV